MSCRRQSPRVRNCSTGSALNRRSDVTTRRPVFRRPDDPGAARRGGSMRLTVATTRVVGGSVPWTSQGRVVRPGGCPRTRLPVRCRPSAARSTEAAPVPAVAGIGGEHHPGQSWGAVALRHDHDDRARALGGDQAGVRSCASTCACRRAAPRAPSGGTGGLSRRRRPDARVKASPYDNPEKKPRWVAHACRAAVFCPGRPPADADAASPSIVVIGPAGHGHGREISAHAGERCGRRETLTAELAHALNSACVRYGPTRRAIR